MKMLFVEYEGRLIMEEFYSETVMDHFNNPRNAHVIQDPDAEGHNGDPSCGDYLVMFLKVDKENVLYDISYVVFGCPAAIATASMTSELAKGKSLEEAMKITEQDVVDALGGLPDFKLHCSNLAVGALRNAIEEYMAKSKQQVM
jgi:nitrogen fixation NifU-like protein